MAARLEASTREEGRAAIRILGTEGEKSVDIHHRMRSSMGTGVYRSSRYMAGRVS